MLHHDRAYIESVDAERRARATRRPVPVDAGNLERVVPAAAAGDRVAWSALVERFAPRVRAIARVHRLAAHDAEDVVQTTWLRLFEHIDSVREPRVLGAWLETTARRESLRVLRANGRERPASAELVDESVAPVDEQRLVAAQRRGALAEAWKRLPGRQRRLLSMLFADPAPSYEEISRTLGMPIGSIGPTRARCLAHLRHDPYLVGAIGEGHDH